MIKIKIVCIFVIADVVFFSFLFLPSDAFSPWKRVILSCSLSQTLQSEQRA